MNEDIQIAELERRIAELRARLPKHSVPASMLIELEELEEALVQARAEAED
ncbi:MAG: histidine kinase [Anaerolineae bacterium]|nr:histidine kinase [Anaerolineae bacterium]